jgi:hypothetical protein
VGKAIYAIDAFPDEAQLWRDDRLEPRAVDNNKAPLPPTNDSARGESTGSLSLMFRLLKKQNYDITGLLHSRK